MDRRTIAKAARDAARQRGLPNQYIEFLDSVEHAER